MARRSARRFRGCGVTSDSGESSNRCFSWFGKLANALTPCPRKMHGRTPREPFMTAVSPAKSILRTHSQKLRFGYRLLGSIADQPQYPLSRYSLFLLLIRTMGNRGAERSGGSGGRTILRTHDQKMQFAG